MAKNRVGLHKEVSAIFDGVPIPKNGTTNNAVRQPGGAPAPQRTGHLPPQLPAQPPQPPPMPKQPRSIPSLPKAAAPKQPKIDTTVKTIRQIPWQRTWEQIKSKFFAPRPGVDTKKQIKIAVLIPALFIVLIFVVVQVFSNPSQQSAETAGPGLLTAADNSTYKIDWQIPDPYPTTLRDPMQFGSVATAAQDQPSGLIVRGIVYSEGASSAVIGTQIVREGEKVAGATIIKINEDSVEFEMNGKKWTQKVQR